MRTISIQLDDEVEKALLWDIVDLDAWARNALFNKARQCADEICKKAIEDKTHIILTAQEKRLLGDYLSQQDIIISSVKDLPDNIKREIVKRARVKSAAEKQAELEKEL